jgi:hypothetical protein
VDWYWREGEIVLRVLARLSFATKFALVLFFNILCVGVANAHVKWFCGYDVAAQPRGLDDVLIAEQLERPFLRGIPQTFCGFTAIAHRSRAAVAPASAAVRPRR